MEVCCFKDMFARLHGFMKSSSFTDVTFVIGNSRLKAHKAILASCSSVFRAMFEAPMEESYKNEVIITDFEAESFAAFLDYIYSRDDKIDTKHTAALLALADKYGIEPLAKLCDVAIEKLLTADNAIEFYILADLHRRCDLAPVIHHFIRDNSESVQNWSKFQDRSDLVKQIFKAPSQQKYLLNQEVNREEGVTWTLQSNDWQKECTGDWVALPLTGSDHKAKAQLVCNDGALDIRFQLIHEMPEPIPIILTITRNKSSLIGFKSEIRTTLGKSSTNDFSALGVPKSFSFSVPFTVTIAAKINQIEKKHPNLLCAHPPHLDKIDKLVGRFADTTIIIDNTKVRLHKLVLATKSDYFSSLFEENREEYGIDGINRNTFDFLVDYMYFNRYPPEEKVDWNLLKGACKLELGGMRDYCISVFGRTMTVEKLHDICSSDDKSIKEQLKPSMVKFATSNPEIIVNSFAQLN